MLANLLFCAFEIERAGGRGPLLLSISRRGSRQSCRGLSAASLLASSIFFSRKVGGMSVNADSTPAKLPDLSTV